MTYTVSSGTLNPTQLNSNDTTYVAEHPTLKSQLDWGIDYSLCSFPGW